MNYKNNNFRTLKDRLENINIKLFFLLIILLNVLVSIVIQWYIISDELYYQFLGEQLRTDLISKIINLKNKWDWVGFIILPIFLFIKVLSVATCFEVGNFVFDWKLKFKQLLRAAMDRETERFTINLLNRLKKQMAVFYISHRLHILKNISDRIYILQKGKIQDIGTHQELLSNKNMYSDYWKDMALV